MMVRNKQKKLTIGEGWEGNRIIGRIIDGGPKEISKGGVIMFGRKVLVLSLILFLLRRRHRPALTESPSERC